MYCLPAAARCVDAHLLLTVRPADASWASLLHSRLSWLSGHSCYMLHGWLFLDCTKNEAAASGLRTLLMLVLCLSPTQYL